MCFTDPINAYLRGNRKRGSTSVDRWGTTISWPADAPGAMPVTENGMAVCPDVTRWARGGARARPRHKLRGGVGCLPRGGAGRLRRGAPARGFMGTGIFEQCHFLMGFENALTSLYEHPREMHELIEYITEYRLDYVRRLIDGLQPDVIFSHDDWGTKDALFMRPEMWRRILQGAVPPVLRLYPLARRDHHPPCRFLPRPDRGRHGRDRHPGLAGRPARRTTFPPCSGI